MKTLFFTGGGSGGHVLPAKTLILEIQKKFPEINLYYIGSYQNIERDLTKDLKIDYFPIFTGKLRRYFSWENFKDFFKFQLGIFQAIFILIRNSKGKTAIVSTGGFVSVPVVIAAFLLRKKIYIHEQTSQAGLANKISSYFANKVFITFSNSEKFFPKDKTILSGLPLRKECFMPLANQIIIEGKDMIKEENILFITGGGNGSLLLNNLVYQNLNKLSKYFIIHQVGASHIEEALKHKNTYYYPMAFLGNEMIEIFKKAKIIISRAGAGTVSELLALNKRSIFIPLKIAQKNEQFFNAKEAQEKLESWILDEDDLKGLDLLSYLEEFEKSQNNSKRENNLGTNKAVDIMIKEILKNS